MTTAHDGPWQDLCAAKERDEMERTTPPCERCARLEHELALARRERDELDRKAERQRRELQRMAAWTWDLECEREDLRHELELAPGVGVRPGVPLRAGKRGEAPAAFDPRAPAACRNPGAGDQPGGAA